MSTSYYQLDPETIAKELETSLEHGLSSDEANRRLVRDGKNEFEEEKQVTNFVKFLLQFKNFLVILLIVAGIISFIFGDYIEGVVILVIIFINALLGYVQEHRAEESLKKLKELAGDDTLVIRDGNEVRVDVKNLVIGDILLMWEGETIGADARILEANSLKVEEGILTGESVPVDKETRNINARDVLLAEQNNMAFMGTTTVKGRGKSIVVRTGMQTEMGKIAKATIESGEQKTPLQHQLEKLGKTLGIVVLVIVAIVVIAEIAEFIIKAIPITEHSIAQLIETSIALAVSAVPEGLAAAITLTLALGMQRMAKKKAIVRKLPAVETLGSVQVICTDKTGTLTQNKMTVQRLWTPSRGMIEVAGLGYNPKGNFIDMASKKQIIIQEEKELLELLKAGFLSSKATITFSSKKNEWQCEGDPTEGAMIVAAMKTPYKVLWDEQTDPVANGELFFDSDRKRMTIIYKATSDGKSELWAYMKGSPESVLGCCDTEQYGDVIVKLDDPTKKAILEKNDDLAGKAFRVIAVAKRRLNDGETNFSIENIENQMTFAGLAGMIDPPRQEVATAIEKAKLAGIRIIMITGDQKATALAIAKALDLKPFEDVVYTCHTAAELEAMNDVQFKEVMKDLDVCARASPTIKARIVRSLQEDFQQVVAMTGDGVNDAPALKKADIGIAMGISGTDVAREASDIILTDDNFATIVVAVEEGRNIFNNMKAFIRLMISSNFDEILTVFFITVILGLQSPFLALGILWLNLITDGLPAFGLIVDPGDPLIMQQQPRGKNASMLHEILIYSIVCGFIAFVVTTWLYLAFYDPADPSRARTVALMTSIFFELASVFVVRTPEGRSMFRYNPVNNKFLVVSVAVAALLQLVIVYVPSVAAVFQLAPIGGWEWIWIFVAVGISMVLLDLTRLLQAKKNRRKQINVQELKVTNEKK